MESITCRNCGTEHQAKFCPECGQKPYFERFNLKQSSAWLFHEVFNLNKGFFYTTKELVLRPKDLMEKFLNRATVLYYHPFRFIFVWASIASIITVFSGVYDQVDAFEELGFQFEGEQQEFMESYLEFIKKYMTFIVMLGIPFLSISTLLFYKSKKYNYTEHLIINSFTYGLSIAVSMPFYLLLFFPEAFMVQSNLNMLIYILVYTYVFSKFFNENGILTFIKVIFINVLAILISFLFGSILAMGLLLIKKVLVS